MTALPNNPADLLTDQVPETSLSEARYAVTIAECRATLSRWIQPRTHCRTCGLRTCLQTTDCRDGWL